MGETIRKYPKSRIKTVDYYGSKRTWYAEFEKLLIYASDLGCDSCIDCFSGSGIISLLASRTQRYKKICLNELSYLVVNYHLVMKNDNAFEKFKHLLKENEWFICNHFDYAKEFRERYIAKRIQVRGLSAKKAAFFYLIQYYSFNAQGGFVEKRKRASDYLEALGDTHLLYKNITITQFHYKKVLKANLNKENNLIILDCPYMQSERVQKESYFVEFTERQHRYMLIELTKEVHKAKILLCGYDSRLYTGYFLRFNKKHDRHWHCIKLLRAGSRKEGAEAKEMWWVNFDIDDFIKQNQNMFQMIY